MSWVKFVNEVTVRTSGIHVECEFPRAMTAMPSPAPMSNHFLTLGSLIRLSSCGRLSSLSQMPVHKHSLFPRPLIHLKSDKLLKETIEDEEPQRVKKAFGGLLTL